MKTKWFLRGVFASLFLIAAEGLQAATGNNTDVAIGKTANTTSAFVGDTVVFTIGFTNFGSSTANNLAGSDVVPSGFSIFAWNSSGSPSAPVYNPTNGQWTIAAIAAGAVDLLTISTTATNSGTYTNTATITSAGNTNNNVASVVVTLTPQTADLMVTKTAGLYGGPPTDQFQPGDVAFFTITITNLGPGTAYNIAGSDVLPAGFTFDGWGNAGSGYYPQYNSTNGTWTLYELPPGNWGSFSILASAASNGTFTNTAAITSAIDSDPNPNNNTASVVVTVATQADLQMGKTASASSVALGQSVIFNLYLTNAGPSSVTNPITVTEVIPPGFQYVSDTSGGSGGSYSPGLGQWTLPFGWPLGVVGISINVLATNTGAFTNTATVIVPPGVTDPNLLNNTASAVVTVTQPLVDLQVTKTAGTNSVYVGGPVPFTITVTNLGPNSASNITVLETLPPGLSFSSAGVPGDTSFNPNTGVWTVPSLAVGNGYALALTALATNAGTFTNSASLTGSTPPDTNAANNSASAVVTATVQLLVADLKITKTANPTNAFTGQQVVFQLQLQNLGPNNVTNSIVVTDCLPAGLQYVSDNSGGAYSPGTCLWMLPGLSTNATASLFITLLATNAGTFTNTATVAVPSGYTDPNLTNNTASAVFTVTNLVADLAVTKTVYTNTLPVFSTFAFSFYLTVTNLGPNTVSNLTLTDLLPAGLTFGGAINFPGSTYTASNGLWSFSVPLAAGQGGAMTIVTGAPQIPGTFTNTVKVNVPSTVTDPNTNNNSANTVVYVLPVYRILGYVANCSSNGIPLANVTLTLSGAANQTTTTFGIGNGNYSFNNVSNGVYTITPSQPGNVFMPANAVVTVSNAWVTVPAFVGGIGLIYGQVTYFGNPVTNQPVTLSGGGLPRPRLMFTDTNGYYIFTNTGAGNYTVTAVATNGYIFTPTNAVIALNATNCSAFTNFVSQGRAIVLRALEAVQVVQDWQNSVPLVQNKRTLVRAHLELLSATNPPVLINGARLIVTNSTGSLTLNPINAPGGFLVTNLDANAVRSNLNASLNFELPNGWRTGVGVVLAFQCTNNVTVSNREPADAGGDPASNGMVRVSFTTVPQIPVKWLFTRWTDTNGVVHGPALGSAGELTARLKSIYPVPDVAAGAAATYQWTNTSPKNTNDDNDDLVDKLVEQIQSLHDREVGTNSKTHYYGIISDIDLGGIAIDIPTNPATSGRSSSLGTLPATPWVYGRNRHAHEIGHTLGRSHAVYRISGTKKIGDWGERAASTTTTFPFMTTTNTLAGLGASTNTLLLNGTRQAPTLGPMDQGPNIIVWGWDSHAGIIVNPLVTYELMGYANRQDWRWISKYTYTNIMNVLINRFGAGGAPLPAIGYPAGGPQPKEVDDYLLVRGEIYLDTDTVAFQPFYPLTTDSPPQMDPGNYTLEVFDSTGGLVWETTFTPDEIEPDHDYPASDTNDIGYFSIAVPMMSDMHSVVVLDSSVPIAQLTASPNAPTVDVQFPAGGEILGGSTYNVQWTGSDADGGPLYYAVEFSPDGGQSWQSLIVDWPVTSLDVDTTALPATTNGLFRVVASDGFNGGSGVSGYFIITNHPPAISIALPLSGNYYISDQQIIFEAIATDVEDGNLDGTNVVWTSSLDGFLGNGEELFLIATDLSEGEHLITATAVDSGGLTNSTSVQIYVLRSPPPTLAIELDGNQILLSWPDSVTNYVLECTTSLSSTAWSAVTNAPVAADATQTVTLNLAPTNQFFRLRMQ